MAFLCVFHPVLFFFDLMNGTKKTLLIFKLNIDVILNFGKKEGKKSLRGIFNRGFGAFNDIITVVIRYPGVQIYSVFGDIIRCNASYKDMNADLK